MKNNSQKIDWSQIEPTGRMLRPSEVIRLTGLSKSQLYALIAEKVFPPLVKIGHRASALPESWLNHYIQQRASEAITYQKTHSDV